MDLSTIISVVQRVARRSPLARLLYLLCAILLLHEALLALGTLRAPSRGDLFAPTPKSMPTSSQPAPTVVPTARPLPVATFREGVSGTLQLWSLTHKAIEPCRFTTPRPFAMWSSFPPFGFHDADCTQFPGKPPGVMLQSWLTFSGYVRFDRSVHVDMLIRFGEGTIRELKLGQLHLIKSGHSMHYRVAILRPPRYLVPLVLEPGWVPFTLTYATAPGRGQVSGSLEVEFYESDGGDLLPVSWGQLDQQL